MDPPKTSDAYPDGGHAAVNIDLALLERKLMDIPGVTAVQDLRLDCDVRV